MTRNPLIGEEASTRIAALFDTKSAAHSADAMRALRNTTNEVMRTA